MLFICVICFLLLYPLYLVDDEVDYKGDIIEYLCNSIDDELVSKDFLNYVVDNYKINALEKLKVVVDKGEYDNNIWHEVTGNSFLVLWDLYNKRYDEMNNISILNKKGDATISFVGDVSLADNFHIMPKYDERGRGIYGILSEDTVKVMRDSDIMVANSEFTISNRGEAMPGKLYTFKASLNRISIYGEMGVNLLTLANNHVYDFGEVAFNDMIDALDEYGMAYVGAGLNIVDAKRPYYFILNGYKIAFVNATRAEKNILTPEATDSSGGVFRCYDPTDFKKIISEVKRESDYVVALVHYGKEDSHDLEQEQIDSSKIYIDAGADIVIGTHAHVLQGIEFYNHKPIVYNLGDFIFNDEDKDTGILQIKLMDSGDMKYYFIPAHQKDEYTEILYNDDKKRVINDMNLWSINVIIDEDGKIREK